MQRLQVILQEITQLTSNMETNYPEIYRYLDEDPLTISTIEGDRPDLAVFEQYLNTLKTKLKTYLTAKHSRSISKPRIPEC